MICGPLVTLALTATLLGQTALKVASVHENLTEQTCTAEMQPLKSNAVAIFKDARGTKLLERRMYVSDFDFYLTEARREGVPLRQSTLFVNVPATVGAVASVELKLLDGSFDRSVKVKFPSAHVATQKLSLR